MCAFLKIIATNVVTFLDFQGDWWQDIYRCSEGKREGQGAVSEGCVIWPDCWFSQVRRRKQEVNMNLLVAQILLTNWCFGIPGLQVEKWRSFLFLWTSRQTAVSYLFSPMRNFFIDSLANMSSWSESNPNSWSSTSRFTVNWLQQILIEKPHDIFFNLKNCTFHGHVTCQLHWKKKVKSKIDLIFLW